MEHSIRAPRFRNDGYGLRLHAAVATSPQRLPWAIEGNTIRQRPVRKCGTDLPSSWGAALDRPVRLGASEAPVRCPREEPASDNPDGVGEEVSV